MHANLLSDPSVVFDAAAPERVVSLVPSTTASLFDLGLGGVVVGITDYCSEPAEAPVGIQRVGGPKTLRVETILALTPDLVIANQEENNRSAVEALAEAGVPVWLTFPITVQAAINDLWTIANLFRSDMAMQQVDFLERSAEWARSAGESGAAVRYFCPIWQEARPGADPWWMTFNARTYPHDVLSLFGGENIFAARDRLTGATDPAEADTRYPQVGLEEILQAAPEMILLPSEPYAYTEDHCREFMSLFAGTPAGNSGRIFAFDGSLITWHGTRLVRALEELPALFAA
jgi:ABC-type Fe3+-hydroxamate transport system substrate-binding protein